MLVQILFLLPGAQAQETPAPETAPAAEAADAAPAPSRWSSTGELRYLASLPPDFVVDAEGHTVGQGFVLDQRLRLGGRYQLPRLGIKAEADLFTGQLLGDAWDLSGTLDDRHREEVSVLRPYAFRPRALAVESLLGPVFVQAGLMTSQWGLGLLANSGSKDPYFGRSDGGDVVLRVMGTTRPGKDSPWAFAAAVDRVYFDDIGSWWPGHQAAYQGVLAALWARPEGPSVGAYAVYRHQTEADRLRKTNVGVLDFTFDVPLEAGPLKLRVAAESAAMLGHTTRSANNNHPDGLRVQQLGAAGLVSAHALEQRVGLVLRGGYSTGDGDPYDDHTQDFAFDPNFDAGMVMFDEVQGALGVAAYGHLNDTENFGQPPDGADVLVAEGAIRHAAFVQPIVEASPLPWLGLRLGGLVGWSTSPIADPFYTGRNGGVPTNQLNDETSGYALGKELDWAVNLHTELPIRGWETQPALLLQGGHYFPSADMGMGRVDLLTATARLRW